MAKTDGSTSNVASAVARRPVRPRRRDRAALSAARLTKAQSQGRHAGDHGQAGHEDGTQTDSSAPIDGCCVADAPAKRLSFGKSNQKNCIRHCNSDGHDAPMND